MTDDLLSRLEALERETTPGAALNRGIWSIGCFSGPNNAFLSALANAFPSLLKELRAGRELRDSMMSHPHGFAAEYETCAECKSVRAYDDARAATEGEVKP